MNRFTSFSGFKKKSLKNPKILAEYKKLQPEFALIQTIIEARIKKGITQEKLAKKMRTKQSVISRLESGRANPSFLFLKKLAEALNTKIKIEFSS
jgi:ribosome-binding protein aMBF1 (putative translation factor)